MAATRMISIIGLKNAGKTTFLVALAAELVRRKFRVMTIKHGSHPADMDQRGKDTWRHWHEGKAERVLLDAPGQRMLLERTTRDGDPLALARRYLDGGDLRAIAFHEDVRVGILPLERVRQFGDPADLFFNVNRPEDLAEAEARWQPRG